MPATKPRKTIFDSSEFTGPDHWTKSTVIAKSPAIALLSAVEKAELARLRVATPTSIPAFAEARARRLAELEGRHAWTKSTVIAKSPAKSPAILAARSIVAGDVSNARAIINAHPIYRAGFTVPEMRAIRGACALAKHKYGCDLSAFEFMW